jgi:hypothetical protein
LYVVRDTNTGNVYIQNDPGQEIQDYMNEVTKDSDVQDLFKSVDQEFQEALDSDEDLKAYFDKIKVSEEKTTKSSETGNSETTATLAETTEAATKASK